MYKIPADGNAPSKPCDLCEVGNAHSSVALEQFTYGDGPEAVVLTAPVVASGHATSAEKSLPTAISEVSRHDAVCRYLGRLTPR